MEELVQVDGSLFEGGGQLVRVAVGLSIITQRPVHISNIRPRRYDSGLAPPQISAIQLLAEISRAQVEGLALGSQELVFYPGVPEPGHYSADCGGQGSVAQLLLAALPVLAGLKAPSELELHGSTDIHSGPSTNFVQTVLQPTLAKMGVHFEYNVVNLDLMRQGTGHVQVRVYPAAVLPLRLVKRPPRPIFAAKVTYKPVPGPTGWMISDKKYLNTLYGAIKLKFRISREEIPVVRIEGPRRVLFLDLWAQFGPHIILHQSAFESFVKNARPLCPSTFTNEACDALLNQVRSSACIDEHLQDQVLVFAAMANRQSALAIHRLTLHSEGVIDIIHKFDLATVRVENERLLIEPRALSI